MSLESILRMMLLFMIGLLVLAGLLISVPMGG